MYVNATVLPVDEAATSVVVVVSVPEPSVARGMNPASCADHAADASVELQFEIGEEVSLNVAVRAPMRLPWAPFVIAAVPASVFPVGMPGVEPCPAKPPTNISPRVGKRLVSEPGLAVVPVPVAPTVESTGERVPGCHTLASATMPPAAPTAFVHVKE